MPSCHAVYLRFVDGVAYISADTIYYSLCTLSQGSATFSQSHISQTPHTTRANHLLLNIAVTFLRFLFRVFEGCVWPFDQSCCPGEAARAKSTVVQHKNMAIIL